MIIGYCLCLLAILSSNVNNSQWIRIFIGNKQSLGKASANPLLSGDPFSTSISASSFGRFGSKQMTWSSTKPNGVRGKSSTVGCYLLQHFECQKITSMLIEHCLDQCEYVMWQFLRNLIIFGVKPNNTLRYRT